MYMKTQRYFSCCIYVKDLYNNTPHAHVTLTCKLVQANQIFFRTVVDTKAWKCNFPMMFPMKFHRKVHKKCKYCKSPRRFPIFQRFVIDDATNVT